ncbi:hypothetical protein ACIBQ5_36145 [Streptomyces massasporeus]|uniref:hypothetical protein n=1 Tax=Streptomyces massasporeus TaxID=67324 RepID=UPI00378DB878
MGITDVTDVHERVLALERRVAGHLDASLTELGAAHPELAEAARRLVKTDTSTPNPYRLLGSCVLGALGESPEHAIPLLAASRIWWVGAETYDDVADGEFDAVATGMSVAQAATVSAACIGVVPLAVAERSLLPEGFVMQWAREYVVGTLEAAEGQTADIASGSGPMTWAAVMKVYVGKTGAAYGRDAALAARLAGADGEAVRGWRALGRIFGVLRQLVNDGKRESAESNEDLINGTRTLLLAVAAEIADRDGELDRFLALRDNAMSKASARRALGDYLASPDVVNSYNSRVRLLERQLTSLLKALAPPTQYRDYVRWMATSSADAACLSADGVGGVA